MLIVITGPMFSGKTSKLLTLMSNYYHAGRKATLFKPDNANRYGKEYVATHNGRKQMAMSINKDRPDKILEWSKELANISLKKDIPGISVFGIDEAQFFEPKGLINCVEELLFNDEWFPIQPVVIISGLSQDSYGRPFGAMPHLLAIADEIIHLKSVCAKSKQLNAATRTFRKDKNNDSQIAVGGTSMYEPRSFEHWVNK